MPKISQLPANLSEMTGVERHDLLQIAIKHENEKKSDQPPIQLIDSCDFIKHLDNDDIDERFKNSRYQLIINSNGHYTAVDIDKRDDKKSLIVLDAVNDPRCDDFLMNSEIYEKGYKLIRAMGLSWDSKSELQKDGYSCSLFAFDHCVQLSYTIPDFHAELESKGKATRNPKRRYVFWDDFPPNFVWNAQSIKFLTAYEEKMKDSISSLDEIMPNELSYHQYINLGICTHSDEWGAITRNDSINVHILSKIIDLKNGKARDIKAELVEIKKEEIRADIDTTVESSVLKAP